MDVRTEEHTTARQAGEHLIHFCHAEQMRPDPLRLGPPTPGTGPYADGEPGTGWPEGKIKNLHNQYRDLSEHQN